MYIDTGVIHSLILLLRGRDGCLKWTELSARDKYVGIMPSLFMHSSEKNITMNEAYCLHGVLAYRTTDAVIFLLIIRVLNIYSPTRLIRDQRSLMSTEIGR